ncbi:hypothetical protein NM208_g6182 [Fusarium decemcellulare]|nr:hypothetical protein NM208_g6182 [Fusarium decemcellulare]
MSSGDASSVSSAGICHSSRDSGSGSSAFSYNSTTSLSVLNTNRRRRRKTGRRRTTGQPGLLQTCHKYQCTFCIETFKHKYDWQRHEKSLHLSLEEWLCSPTGATVLDPGTGAVLCVYCGEAEPDQMHLNGHNHRVCQERAPKERTFYRKDHLRQHLKLVHESNFREWPMDQWKVASREIQSRCGFCNMSLATWTDRADHLAEHFKSGSTMADWKGGWGFHPQVLEIVDNAMPPYLIHYERSSPLPISAISGPADTPTSAYELIKLELENFTREHLATHGWLPSDAELQQEGCSIIFGADIVSSDPTSTAPSWLRDLFVCSEVSQVARLRPMQQIAKSRISQLKINGKGSIFDNCELENELLRFALMHNTLNLTLSDIELQQEASNILGHMEAFSPDPSKHYVDFLARLIWGSTQWLELFRQRTQLSTNDIEDENNPQPNIDSVEPTTENTGPNATEGQLGLLQENMSSILDLGNWTLCSPDVPGRVPYPEVQSNQQVTTDGLALPSGRRSPVATSVLINHGSSYRGEKPPNGIPFLLNDHNSYRRLAAGLSRFVASAISPNNPNSHVPTDEELQYQARWMWYDDDDPWNQTPADNVEWLREFKRDVGLFEEDS